MRRWQLWMRRHDPLYVFSGRDPERAPAPWMAACAFVAVVTLVTVSESAGYLWAVAVLLMLLVSSFLAAAVHRRRTAGRRGEPASRAGAAHGHANGREPT